MENLRRVNPRDLKVGDQYAPATCYASNSIFEVTYATTDGIERSVREPNGRVRLLGWIERRAMTRHLVYIRQGPAEALDLPTY